MKFFFFSSLKSLNIRTFLFYNKLIVYLQPRLNLFIWGYQEFMKQNLGFITAHSLTILFCIKVHTDMSIWIDLDIGTLLLSKLVKMPIKFSFSYLLIITFSKLKNGPTGSVIGEFPTYNVAWRQWSQLDLTGEQANIVSQADALTKKLYISLLTLVAQ